MTWYGGDISEKLLSIYCVNLARNYFGMSPWSWGLARGLQRGTETHQRVSAPGISEGRSKYRSLASRGKPFGLSPGVQGPTARTFQGPVQLNRAWPWGPWRPRPSSRLGVFVSPPSLRLWRYFGFLLFHRHILAPPQVIRRWFSLTFFSDPYRWASFHSFFSWSSLSAS